MGTMTISEDDFEALISAFRKSILDNADVRREERMYSRVINMHAQTVVPGMMLDMPAHGWTEVIGKTTTAGYVMFSDGSHRFWSVPTTHRVRVRYVL